MATIDDRLRIALSHLFDAEASLCSAIKDLRADGLTTEADNLQTVLDSLITQRQAAQAAVAAL